MKKIVIALMTLTITFGLLGIGTYAVFGEPETNKVNNFDDGTLTLDVDDGAVRTYIFKNIKPGDSGGWIGYQNLFDRMTWTVQNTGSLDGTLEVSIENIVDMGAELSTQIRPQMRANGVWVRESSNLRNLPTYQRDLAPGEEVTIDIAWKFYEAAGNEYQRAITKLNVRFYIVQKYSPTSPPSPPDTPTVTPTLAVAEITEPFLEVLGISELPFTGLNPIIPIGGILVILLGLAMVTLSVVIKKKSGYKGIKR